MSFEPAEPPNRADGVADGAHRDSRGLTPASEITLEYIAASEALQPFVTTFYYFRCDDTVIRDIQPAAVGSLMVYLRGEGVMHFGKRSDRSHQISLLAPLTYAAPFEVDGPFHCIGASLSPLGWAALTGLAANKARDRLFDAGEVLGAEATQLGLRLRENYLADGTDPAELCAELGEYIGRQLKPIAPRHRDLIAAVADWLSSGYNPDIEELGRATGYSLRQVQRLVERYFGVPPKMLLRKYRALRVVAQLNDTATNDEQTAKLLDQFYDQSHLIREVRLFAGRTPSRFGDSESPILERLLDVRNFREISPNVARLPED